MLGWLCFIVVFIIKYKFCFSVNDDEGRISLSALYLFVLMCFFWQMKGLWATTTMKIFLFLDSNNVFENKVSAALMCSHYSKPAFSPPLFPSGL